MSEVAAAAPPKRLFVKTYGCQMNVYDSERIADVLRPMGYTAATGVEDADLVVLNTCHIREKAAEKVYSEVGRLNELRELRAEAGGAPLTIAVAGCVAQAEGAEIMARAPAVDLVVGPQAYHQLPQMLSRTSRVRGDRLAAAFAPEAKFEALKATRRASGPSAFLTVQEGCDKFCTFCVVPYTRGAEYGRPVQAVLAEARGLAEQGVREINLLGQNVNAYAGVGSDGAVWSLARLARALAGIEGLSRLRYTTSHPRDMGEDLIEAHAELEALMPYLHLPVQSGSDRVLKAMNRGHTAESYLRLIERIRGARADMAISGDFIVGFPGETEAEFERTLQLVHAVGYASAYSFKYSPRPGTPAATMADQVPEPVKTERLARLQAVIDAQIRTFNAATVGRRLPVLLEKRGRNPGQLIGRSPYLQAVWANAPEALIGEVVEMEIVGLGAFSLAGRLASPSPSGGGSRTLSREGEEFLPLGDEAVRAVAGPHSRHAALLEDGLRVLVETPGGGVRLKGDSRARAIARRAVNAIAARVDAGAEVTESDVRAAITAARTGEERPAGHGPALPIGRRGAIAAKTPAQARYLDALAAHELTFGVGPAGTGKTFLAVAYGASLLMRGEVDRLVLTRPAVEAGERLGFLPGDLTEKVDPYLAPIWEALGDIMGAEPLRRRRERGEIEVAPIAFMRGRTLAHAYVIVDEAQNTTRLQMKMVLTRLGEGARMAVTGDPSQVDLVNARDSGLSHAVRLLDGVKGVAVARFEASDVVRHPLVERIVKAYDADAARTAGGGGVGAA